MILKAVSLKLNISKFKKTTFYTHVNIKIVSKASADQYLDI